MISADEARRLLADAEWTDGDPPLDGRRRLFLAARNLAQTVIDQAEEIEELEDKVFDLENETVPKTWAGLAAILDYAYPEEIFPTLEDDPRRDLGPRVVSLLRLLDRERASRIFCARCSAPMLAQDPDNTPDNRNAEVCPRCTRAVYTEEIG